MNSITRSVSLLALLLCGSLITFAQDNSQLIRLIENCGQLRVEIAENTDYLQVWDSETEEALLRWFPEDPHELFLNVSGRSLLTIRVAAHGYETAFYHGLTGVCSEEAPAPALPLDMLPLGAMRDWLADED